MRNIRKIFVFLALVLIIGVLVSCTPSNLESIPDKTDTAAETSTTVDDETEDTDSTENVVTSTPQSSSDPVTSSSSSKSSSITSKKQTTMLYDDSAPSDKTSSLVPKDKHTVEKITCVEDLQTLAAEVNRGCSYAGRTVYLEADIDLFGVDWIPIGTYNNPFMGEFVGNNHTIKNLTVNSISESIKNGSDSVHLGIFGYVVDATINGLNIENVSVNLNSPNNTQSISIGGIVGGAGSYKKGVKIISCKTSGNISAVTTEYGMVYIGGVLGKLYLSADNPEYCIQYLQSDMNITADGCAGYCGGIIGSISIVSSSVSSNSIISDIIYKGTINNRDGLTIPFNGGFCGSYYNKNECNIQNVFAAFSVNRVWKKQPSAADPRIGVLIGEQVSGCSDLYLKNIYGNVLCGDSVTTKGIIGSNKHKVHSENCLITGSIPNGVGFDASKWDLSNSASPELFFS